MDNTSKMSAAETSKRKRSSMAEEDAQEPQQAPPPASKKLAVASKNAVKPPTMPGKWSNSSDIVPFPATFISHLNPDSFSLPWSIRPWTNLNDAATVLRLTAGALDRAAAANISDAEREWVLRYVYQLPFDNNSKEEYLKNTFRVTELLEARKELETKKKVSKNAKSKGQEKPKQ